MSRILSRSIGAGSLGLVIDGASTTTYGTQPSSGDNIQWLRVGEVSITEQANSLLVDDLAGTGSGVEGARFVSSNSASGSIRGAATLVESGAVFAWALGGTPASTGAGPYTHTYPVGVDSPWRSAFMVYGAADGDGLQDEWRCLQLDSITIDFGADAIAYFTANVTGAAASRSSTYQLGVAATETPAAATMAAAEPILGSLSGALSWGGNTIAARTASLTVTRPLDRATDFGAAIPGEGVLSGPIVVELSVTRAADEADSAIIRAALMAGTSGDLSLGFTTGTKSLTVYLENAVIISRSAPFTSGGALVETVVFRAQALGLGDYGAKIVVVNAASAAVTSNGTMA
jgi:hypothetical protein